MTETDTTDETTAKYSCDPEYNDLVIEDEGPEELREMFQTLREHNVVTIEGRVCCTGCASASADNHCHKLEDEGHDVKGAAYYHEQDLNENYGSLPGEEDFATYDVDSIHVGFGGRGEATSAEVAGLIMGAAHEAGLEAEWNGSEAQKVEVILG